MENTNELYIDIKVKDVPHRISILHGDYPCDAEISMDGNKIAARLKVMSTGGAFMFKVEDSDVIITILNNGKGFVYDCFIDEVSVQNDMPWRIESMAYPKIIKWAKVRQSGKASFVSSEIIKGILIGCAIFFIMWFLGRFEVIEGLKKVSWLHLAVSVVPLTLLYSFFAPLEWNKNERAYNKLQSYQDITPVDEQNRSETADDGVTDGQPEEVENTESPENDNIQE